MKKAANINVVSLIKPSMTQQSSSHVKKGVLEEQSDASLTLSSSDTDRLLAFQFRRDSLRLSASNVAAMVGFHPWKDLPELAMQLVYQGSDGQALLRRDSANLGLELVSETQMLHEIASKASTRTKKAFEKALQIKDGQKIVSSVQDARLIKETVIKEAVKSGKLSEQELQMLQEGTRSAVDTGYGTWNENEALDYYEKQSGYTIEERNAEVRCWPFALDDNHEIVVPIQSAQSEALHLRRLEKRQKTNETTDAHDEEIGKPPFFYILASVDGIRQELSIQDTADGEENWSFRRVVVECKHRMNRIHKVPPLYEQIQSVIYCLMYEAVEADIIQVMRQNDFHKKQSVNKTKSTPGMQTLDNWIKKLSNEENDDNQQPGVVTLKETTNVAVVDLTTATAAGVALVDLTTPLAKDTCSNSSLSSEREITTAVQDSKILMHFDHAEKEDDVTLQRHHVNADVLQCGSSPRTEVEQVQGDAMEASTDDSMKKLCTYSSVCDQKATTYQRGERSSSSLSEIISDPDAVQDESTTDASNFRNDVVDSDTIISLPIASASDTKVHRARSSSDGRPKPVVVVSRIMLDDPVMQHRSHFTQIICPRLRSFVEAIYAIRQDDDKRYRLLVACCNGGSIGRREDGWKLLFSECPWLEHCETSYCRSLGLYGGMSSLRS